MTDWIDYFVYIAFIVGFYWVMPRQLAAWNRLALGERNHEWLAAHPDAPQRYNGSRGYVRISDLIGAAWLAVLTAYQIGALPMPDFGPSGAKWQLLWADHRRGAALRGADRNDRLRPQSSDAARTHERRRRHVLGHRSAPETTARGLRAAGARRDARQLNRGAGSGIDRELPRRRNVALRIDTRART